MIVEMEKEIDTYVNSIYNGYGETKEIVELKNEMRNHLLQTVANLQSEGYSDVESIRMAIDRFGEQSDLRGQLNSLYGNQNDSQPPSSATNVLAWLSLITGGLSLIMFVFFPFSVPLAILSLILGIVSRKSKNRRIAWIGMILSAIALVFCVFAFLFLIPTHTGTVKSVGISHTGQQ